MNFKMFIKAKPDPGGDDIPIGYISYVTDKFKNPDFLELGSEARLLPKSMYPELFEALGGTYGRHTLVNKRCELETYFFIPGFPNNRHTGVAKAKRQVKKGKTKMSNSQIDRALAKQLVKVADNYERMIKAEARVKELEAMPARKEPTMNNDEVLKLAEGLIHRRHNTPQEMWCLESELLTFAAKLRAKDAELIKAISEAAEQIIVQKDEEIAEWQRRYNAQSAEYSLCRKLLTEKTETIAQQKEEIAGLEEIYKATNKALNHVTNELSAIQAREAMLVEQIQKEISFAIQDCEGGVDIDSLNRILSNSTEHTEKWLAEVKAKTLEDAANRFRNENCTLLPSTIECAETLETWANELREAK